MDPVFEWGINVIQDLQAFFGASGVGLGRFFTFLGNQEFYLLLFPFLLWCMDWAIGMRLTILYLLSVVLNTDVKDVIDQPRPYVVQPSINLVEPDASYVYGEGFGMPSGHAQLSVTIWGVLALFHTVHHDVQRHRQPDHVRAALLEQGRAAHRDAVRRPLG